MTVLAWLNRADAAAVTADSELASMPVTLVQNAHLAKKWGTAAGVKAAALTLDLGAARACSVLGVFGANLTGNASMRLRASNADATAAAGELLDTGVVAAGVKDGYGAIYKPFNAVTARYWRLDLADASVSDNLLVGRVFLGPSWRPTCGVSFGWGLAVADASRVGESTGGQEYIDVRPRRRMLSFELDWMNEAEMFDNAFAMAMANGIATDVLVIRYDSSPYLSEQSIWGRIVQSTPLIHRAAQIFKQPYVIKERR